MIRIGCCMTAANRTRLHAIPIVFVLRIQSFAARGRYGSRAAQRVRRSATAKQRVRHRSAAKKTAIRLPSAGDDHALAAHEAVDSRFRATRSRRQRHNVLCARSARRPARAWNPVGTGPGQSAVTLTPRRDSSLCSASLNESTIGLAGVIDRHAGAGQESGDRRDVENDRRDGGRGFPRRQATARSARAH